MSVIKIPPWHAILFQLYIIYKISGRVWEVVFVNFPEVRLDTVDKNRPPNGNNTISSKSADLVAILSEILAPIKASTHTEDKKLVSNNGKHAAMCTLGINLCCLRDGLFSILGTHLSASSPVHPCVHTLDTILELGRGGCHYITPSIPTFRGGGGVSGLCLVYHSVLFHRFCLSDLPSGWQNCCWTGDWQGYCFHFPSIKHSLGRRARESRRRERGGGGVGNHLGRICCY